MGDLRQGFWGWPFSAGQTHLNFSGIKITTSLPFGLFGRSILATCVVKWLSKAETLFTTAHRLAKRFALYRFSRRFTVRRHLFAAEQNLDASALPFSAGRILRITWRGSSGLKPKVAIRFRL